MTIIRIQATKPTGQALRGSQFARARAQRPSPTAANYCSPRSSCGPSRSSCGPSSRAKYASKTCAPCGDPMDPFGIMPMLNNMARMSSVDYRPVVSGYAGVPVPRTIAVDIYEKADGYELLADIPGVDKDQIKLVIDQDFLVIEVEKTKPSASSSSSSTASTSAAKSTTPASTATSGASTTAASRADEETSSDDEDDSNGDDEVFSLRRERSQGFARRRLRLSKKADIGSVQASYENGILKLTVAKKEESRQQRINIE